MREALWRLCRYGGDPDVEAHYSAILAAVDLEGREKARIRRHVFLARYGKQSVLQWDDVSTRTVRQYAEALAELLREEDDAVNAAAARAAATSATKG